MTLADGRSPFGAACAAVRACADTMEAQAASLLQTLPNLPMDENLRASALEFAADLRDASSRVTFELALLQAETAGQEIGTTTLVQRLAGLDAAMMGALARATEVVDRFEQAAEGNENFEPAFVLVIEAAGVMLQSLDRARAATEAFNARRDAPRD